MSQSRRLEQWWFIINWIPWTFFVNLWLVLTHVVLKKQYSSITIPILLLYIYFADDEIGVSWSSANAALTM